MLWEMSKEGRRRGKASAAELCQPRVLPHSAPEAAQHSSYRAQHHICGSPSDMLQTHPVEKQETASPNYSIPSFFVKMQRVTLTADAPKHLSEGSETESLSRETNCRSEKMLSFANPASLVQHAVQPKVLAVLLVNVVPEKHWQTFKQWYWCELMHC